MSGFSGASKQVGLRLTTDRSHARLHTIGVGAGPANLSLAALFERVAPHRIALFEQSPTAEWHPTLLHEGVRMQTSWIKDLVSLVDPQHRLSFLSYLVSTGRVYAFLSAKYEAIPRLEYVGYLAWASAQLEHLYYGTRIDRISFGHSFGVYSEDRLLARSDHLVIGLGTRAKAPPRFAGLDGGRAIPADRLARHARTLALDPSARVAVVGSGQTGAECVLELVRLGLRDIWWFGRRPWFQTLEDSCSANDFYRPAYTGLLPNLPAETQRCMGEQQVLTTDGISDATMRLIYQRNYEAMLATGRNPVTLLPGRDVLALHPDRHGLSLTCSSAAGQETFAVSRAILAVGREPVPLPFDDDLMDLLEVDEQGDPLVAADFSLRWRGPPGHKLFAQNLGSAAHGRADRNLSLLASRSATIINSLFEREVFAIRDTYVTTNWAGGVSGRPDATRQTPDLERPTVVAHG